MTALHLVRIPIRIDALARWARERGWTGNRPGAGFDEGRAIHHLLSETLGPRTVNCFRLLTVPRRPEGNLYLYSPTAADDLRTAAETCAWPEHLSVLHLSRLTGKVMPETWQTGQRLGFDLRTRPVRRLMQDLEGSGGRFGRGAEIDAYLVEALRRHPAVANGMAGEDRTREAVYLDWLQERLLGVASIDLPFCRLARYRQARTLRGQQGLVGPDATIHGTLAVSDPERFASVIQRGIGRHRAYGYGMLLLRPAGKPVPGR